MSLIIHRLVCRVERKERARLKNVKFHGRTADSKGVRASLTFCHLLTNLLFTYSHYSGYHYWALFTIAAVHWIVYKQFT